METNFHIIMNIIAQLLGLKLSKLKNLVYRLTNTVNTKDFQKWIKKRKKCLDLSNIMVLTKKGLPNLRYKYNWQEIAVAILKMMTKIPNLTINLDLWDLQYKPEVKNKKTPTKPQKITKQNLKSSKVANKANSTQTQYYQELTPVDITFQKNNIILVNS